jgi:hypothetical protein
MKMDKNYGNISIKKNTRKRIDDIRRKRLQTFDTIVNMLLDVYEESLSEEE